MRGENAIAELCRREGINQNLYSKWSKGFLEASKQLTGRDTKHQASSDEFKDMRSEMEQPGALVAEFALKNRVLKIFSLKPIIHSCMLETIGNPHYLIDLTTGDGKIKDRQPLKIERT